MRFDRRFPAGRAMAFFGLAIALIFSTQFCFKKPPPITYLSPTDRLQEGFLDPMTYQIVSFGNALDLSKPLDPKLSFVPASIGEQFDQEAFVDFNNKQLEALKLRKPTTGIPLSEIMAAEANQLNPQDLNLALVDEKIRAPMEVKRALFDNACLNARIVGLYRWLLSGATQMRLLHGATLPQEKLAQTGLDVRYFPPRAYYVAESAFIAKNIDSVMAKKDFRYEIIQEVFSKSEKFECKVVIHVRKKNLQIDMPYLAPL